MWTIPVELWNYVVLIVWGWAGLLMAGLGFAQVVEWLTAHRLPILGWKAKVGICFLVLFATQFIAYKQKMDQVYDAENRLRTTQTRLSDVESRLTKTEQDLGRARRDNAARSENERNLFAALDDRVRLQKKADEYAVLLGHGHSYSIEWNLGINPAEKRQRAFEWLDKVRSLLLKDFGLSVANRFNLGKPQHASLGLSEPAEHEARVAILDTLIQEMRSGTLHLKVEKRDSGN